MTIQNVTLDSAGEPQVTLQSGETYDIESMPGDGTAKVNVRQKTQQEVDYETLASIIADTSADSATVAGHVRTLAALVQSRYPNPNPWPF